MARTPPRARITPALPPCYLAGASPGTGSEAELGITVDQVAAKHIGQDSPLPSLELSIEDGSLSCGAGLSCAYRNTISWQGPKSPLPMENNPQVVFERLFGDGATAAAARGAAGRGAQPARLDHLGSVLAAEDAAGHRSRSASTAISPMCGKSSGASRWPRNRCPRE